MVTPEILPSIEALCEHLCQLARELVAHAKQQRLELIASLESKQEALAQQVIGRCRHQPALVTSQVLAKFREYQLLSEHYLRALHRSKEM